MGDMGKVGSDRLYDIIQIGDPAVTSYPRASSVRPPSVRSNRLRSLGNKWNGVYEARTDLDAFKSAMLKEKVCEFNARDLVRCTNSFKANGVVRMYVSNFFGDKKGWVNGSFLERPERRDTNSDTINPVVILAVLLVVLTALVWTVKFMIASVMG